MLIKQVWRAQHAPNYAVHLAYISEMSQPQRSPLSLISILTHVDLVTRRVFFMVSEVQIIIFQLFMEDTVVGVKSTTYSGLITSGFFRTNNNNNKRIF